MTEDRMLRALAELDEPAAPSAEFADRLLRSLLVELELAPSGPVDERVVSAEAGVVFGRSAAHRARPDVHAGRRQVLTLLAAALLMLALVASAVLLAGSTRAETPGELLARSRAAYLMAPAVRFEMTDNLGIPGTTTVMGDGRGTWRSTTPDSSADSYTLYDGTRVGIYDASLRTWNVVPVEDGGPPYPFNTEFAWTEMAFPNMKARLTPVDCADAVAVEPTEVAGRQAVGIACPSIDMTYWLDPATGLVLRTVAGERSPYGKGAGSPPAVREVQSLELVAAPDRAMFSWDGPRVEARVGPISGTGLVVAERPPTWASTSIDGEPIELPATGTPTAVMLSSTWCSVCLDGIAAFDAAASREPGVRSVLVLGNDEPGTVLGYRSGHPFTVATVADWDGALATAWGVMSVPSLVLLDAQGRVVDLLPGDPRSTDLAGALAALSAGTPLPSPLPVPQATPAPSAAPGCTDPETHVVCAGIGEEVPAWSGRTAASREVGSATVSGRPVLLWFENIASCGGVPCPQWVTDAVREVAAIDRAYDGRVTVVLVVSGEYGAGDTQTLMRTAGADFDVLYDWDRSLGDAVGQMTSGVVLLDAAGRLVDQRPGVPQPDVLRATLDRLLEEQP